MALIFPMARTQDNLNDLEFPVLVDINSLYYAAVDELKQCPFD